MTLSPSFRCSRSEKEQKAWKNAIKTVYDIYSCCGHFLGDLKTRKRTGTSCHTKIQFSSQTSKFLIKYNLLRFQISC